MNINYARGLLLTQMQISLDKAVDLISRDQIVAIPTDTVYGLGCRYQNPGGVKALYETKNRPLTQPILILIATIDQALELVTSFPEEARMLAKHFWPGPLTLVLPANCDAIPSVVRANKETIGIRIPNNPETLELIKMTGPLACPSANLSGKFSSTTPSHIEEDFGTDFPILETSSLPEGLESTIVSCQNGKIEILREGMISEEEIKQRLPPNFPIEPPSSLLASESSPRISPFAEDCKEGTVLGFSDRQYPSTCNVLILGESTNIEEVRRNFYRILRKAKLPESSKIFIDLRNLNPEMRALALRYIKKLGGPYHS